MNSLRHRSPKIGLFLDIGEYPEDSFLGIPARSRRPDRWADIVEMARLAEQVGFDSIMAPDHLLYRLDPGQPEGTWESFSILSALAAITERVEISHIVASTQFRNPAIVAKMADTIDEISGGRFTLGIGAGWYDGELKAFGYPTDHPVGWFEEALQIIHGLLRNGHIDFAGEHYTVRECELRPRGPRPAGAPIMIGMGGSGPRMLRLVAQYADIWNGIASSDAPVSDRYTFYRERRDRLDRACEAIGRDPATLERTWCEIVHLPRGPEYETRRRFPAISGNTEEIAEALSQYAAEGVSHLIIRQLPFSLEGIETMGSVISMLKSS